MVTTFPLLFDALIGELFITIFGSPLLLGIFLTITVYVFAIVMKLSFEATVLTLFFALMTFIIIYIPAILGLVILGLGIFFGLYLFYNIFGR